MKIVPEPNREIPVADEMDVPVGGGPVGVGVLIPQPVDLAL